LLINTILPELHLVGFLYIIDKQLDLNCSLLVINNIVLEVFGYRQVSRDFQYCMLYF